MRLLRISLTCWLVALAGIVNAQQRFFNLTVEDVTIDSLLPEFIYAIPLDEDYDAYAYELEIRYPEFIDMDDADEALYAQVSGAELPELPEIRQQIVVDRKQAKLEFSLVPIVERDGKKQFLVSFMMALTPKAKRRVRGVRAASSSSADRYAAHSRLATGRWVKIRVAEDGIYQLTNSLLTRAGFSDPSKVSVYGYGGHLTDERLSGSSLQELDDLPEVPTCTIGGKRLFYAKGTVSWKTATATTRVRNPYSDYGYYFLSENSETPLTVDSLEFMNEVVGYPNAADYHSLHEVDNYSWLQGGRNLYENSSINEGSSRNYVSRNLSPGQTGSVYIYLTANKTSKARISHNGEEVGTISLSPRNDYDKGCGTGANYTLNAISENDTITIETLSGGPVRLDYIAYRYDEPATAPDLLTTTFPAPEYVYGITNQDHHADAVADMVIIIPTSQKLLAQAQRLADFHAQHDSLSVRIVPADELFNEFSSGTPDAGAYRRYLKMMYDRAESGQEPSSSCSLATVCGIPYADQ